MRFWSTTRRAKPKIYKISTLYCSFHSLLLAVLPVCYLTLATLAQAQEPVKPEAPKPKANSNKAFIAGVSLLAAAKTADAITTRQLLDRGGWENDPIFGRHPSNARLTGILATEFAAQALVFHFTERSKHRWLRWAGRAYIGITIEEHSRLAACNSGINVQVPGQHCKPLVPNP